MYFSSLSRPCQAEQRNRSRRMLYTWREMIFAHFLYRKSGYGRHYVSGHAVLEVVCFFPSTVSFQHVSWDSLLIILAAQAHPDTGSNFKEAWHPGSLTVGMSMYRSHMVTCLLHMLTIKLMETICKHVMPKVEIYAATNCSTYG